MKTLLIEKALSLWHALHLLQSTIIYPQTAVPKLISGMNLEEGDIVWVSGKPRRNGFCKAEVSLLNFRLFYNRLH